jgi:micrococcal nuclease
MPRPRPRTIVPWLLVAAAAVAWWAARRDRPDGGEARTATVERVIDGDTIVVRAGDARERVRYIGMDTPESVRPGTPVQCFAERASALNRRLVAGRTVRLVADVERTDRYGRTLAYVYREPDGLFVNAELVRRGYARTLAIPPDVRFAARLAALAREARAARRGLWSAC